MNEKLTWVSPSCEIIEVENWAKWAKTNTDSLELSGRDKEVLEGLEPRLVGLIEKTLMRNGYLRVSSRARVVGICGREPQSDARVEAILGWAKPEDDWVIRFEDPWVDDKSEYVTMREYKNVS